MQGGLGLSLRTPQDRVLVECTIGGVTARAQPVTGSSSQPAATGIMTGLELQVRYLLHLNMVWTDIGGHVIASLSVWGMSADADE